jgi:hypothetical protein
VGLAIGSIQAFVDSAHGDSGLRWRTLNALLRAYNRAPRARRRDRPQLVTAHLLHRCGRYPGGIGQLRQVAAHAQLRSFAKTEGVYGDVGTCMFPSI